MEYLFALYVSLGQWPANRPIGQQRGEVRMVSGEHLILHQVRVSFFFFLSAQAARFTTHKMQLAVHL